MKLIVGLGNPGRLYANSRHNIGFSIVKALSRIYKIPLKKESGNPALSAKARVYGQNLILAAPLTFMNLSGIAVAGLLKKYRIDLANLLVVLDDLDLEFGRIKLRPYGSSGGHRGLQSIIDSIGSQSFARLRIGIGRPPHQLVHKKIEEANWCGGRPVSNTDTADYVLSPFSRKEKEEVKQSIEKAVQCCQDWFKKGVSETMNPVRNNLLTGKNGISNGVNIFNRRSAKNE